MSWNFGQFNLQELSLQYSASSVYGTPLGEAKKCTLYRGVPYTEGLTGEKASAGQAIDYVSYVIFTYIYCVVNDLYAATLYNMYRVSSYKNTPFT